MRDLPEENLPLSGQIRLLDSTLDSAEEYLNARRFSDATNELTCIWDYRYTIAQGMCRNRSDEMILDLRAERHKKLLKQLNLHGGIIRRLLRKFM